MIDAEELQLPLMDNVQDMLRMKVRACEGVKLAVSGLMENQHNTTNQEA